MTSAGDALVAALQLPAAALQTHRLTKKDILAQWDARSPADAKLLGRLVASARIVAVLSPATVNVPAAVSHQDNADMVPVLDVVLAAGTRVRDATRVAELLHRAMPRPAALALSAGLDSEWFSFALSRASRTEAGMSVIEAHLLLPASNFGNGSLAVSVMDKTDLASLYRDVVRFAAADGRPASRALSARDAVEQRQRIEAIESALSGAVREAARERVMQRKIDLNSRVTELRQELQTAAEALYGSSPRAGLQIQDHKVGP